MLPAGWPRHLAPQPHKAFLYETAAKALSAMDTNAVARMTAVWPEADCRGGPSGTNKWFVTDRPELRHYLSADGSVYDGVGADCMVAGGDWFEEVSDGLQGGLLLGDGLITTAGLNYYINQVRFHVYMSCDDGVYGGYANSTLFTRGGAGVFSLGFTHTAGVGAPQVSDCSMEDDGYRGLIGAGESIGTAAAETNDADSDRMLTWQEYVAGTDPTNPASRLLLSVTMGGGLPVVTVESIAPGILYGATNRYYALESTTNLLTGPWSPVDGFSNVPAATGPVITYAPLACATNSFFRCKAWLGP